MRGNGVAAFEDDVAGQVFVGAAEAVADPGAGAGMSEEGEAGVYGEVPLGVFVDGAGHGADDGEVVGAMAQVGEEAADVEAALAMLLEFEGAGEDFAVVVELGAFDFDGHGLTGFFFEAWFGVEGVNVRDAAGHVAEDDVFGFRRVFAGAMASSWRGSFGGGESLAGSVVVQEAGKCQQTKTARAFFEHFSSRDGGAVIEHR